MVTQEAHIELDLLLQKVNTHWNQNFLPQEKDLFLNREVTRFIKQRLNRLSNLKGQALFDTIKRTSDLIPLLKTAEVPILKQTSKEARILLPFDYLYYVSSDVGICCKCTSKNIIKQTVYEMEFDAPKSVNDFPYIINAGLFTFTIEASDINSNYLIESQVPYYKNNIMLVKALQILLPKKNNTRVEFKYNKLTNKFIARSYAPFSINYNAAAMQTYDKYEDFDAELFAETRIENEEFWRTAQNSHLSRSTDQSMLCYLRENFMGISLPNGVVYGTARLVYISKPQIIDLSLQSDCNLSDEAMEEIIANTAQRLHGVLGTDNYEKYVRENILIE